MTTVTVTAPTFPGQGLLHRSATANLHAQNTVQNPHFSGTSTTTTTTTTGTLPTRDNFLYYYHPDHLGSTSHVTDDNGKLFEHIEYFPFGESWVEEKSNTQRTPYLFTGKELDEETGLYYFGARYYDPRTSVWQSNDSEMADYLNGKRGLGGIFNSRNLGLYSYGHQKPLDLLDPDGRSVYLIDTTSGHITRGKTNNSFDVYFITDGKRTEMVGAFNKNSRGLIRLPSSFSYVSGSGRSIRIGLKEGNGYRAYTSGEALASLIGAAYDTGFSDFTIVGFSKPDGSSPDPSTSHKRGMNGDIRYLRKDKSGGPLSIDAEPSQFDEKRQAKLNGALRKYGWKDILGFRYSVGGEEKVPEGTRHFRNHHNHEHLQGYRPSLTDK